MEYITKPELAQWYHATLFVPINYTLIQSIKKGYFTTSPNLTSKLINKHLTPSMTTSKGHMHQTIKNLKSTKPQDPRTLQELPMKPLVQRTNTVFTNIIYHKRQIATYLTGKFPVTSNRVNKYIFVLYDYDSNCILIRPMNSISDSEFIRVFTDLHQHLLTRGFNTSYIRLYNKAFPAFQRELKANNIDLQLSPPPVMHLLNVVERAISTFKYHFTAQIFSTDPDFPRQNWDRLL